MAAWPIRAEIVRHGQVPNLLLVQLLREGQKIENTGSRVEALYSLWQGVAILTSAERAPVEQAQQMLECRLRRQTLRELAQGKRYSVRTFVEPWGGC